MFKFNVFGLCNNILNVNIDDVVEICVLDIEVYYLYQILFDIYYNVNCIMQLYYQQGCFWKVYFCRNMLIFNIMQNWFLIGGVIFFQLINGFLEWVDNLKEVLIDWCILELWVNVILNIENNNIEFVVDKIFSIVCFNNCSNIGFCVNGKIFLKYLELIVYSSRLIYDCVVQYCVLCMFKIKCLFNEKFLQLLFSYFICDIYQVFVFVCFFLELWIVF